MRTVLLTACEGLHCLSAPHGDGDDDDDERKNAELNQLTCIQHISLCEDAFTCTTPAAAASGMARTGPTPIVHSVRFAAIKRGCLAAFWNRVVPS